MRVVQSAPWPLPTHSFSRGVLSRTGRGTGVLMAKLAQASTAKRICWFSIVTLSVLLLDLWKLVSYSLKRRLKHQHSRSQSRLALFVVFQDADIIVKLYMDG